MSERFKTLSQELAHEFAEAGVTDAFLVTGGAIAPFTSAIAEQGRIRMHFMLTEQSAGIAAEAYGYLDLRPALLVITSGPGVTNALTPVAAAWTNSSPVIVVSGQARSSDVALSQNSSSRQVGSQHLRTDQLVGSIVKRFIELKEANASKSLISRLIKDSTEGRPGPVWLSIPQDLQRGFCSAKELSLVPLDVPPLFNSIEFKELVKGYLSKSKAPSILVGAGARFAFPQILKFAEKFQIPILTTWPAMDLIHGNHPLYCGRPGSIPSTWLPNLINVETDFLLVFGARLDLGQVGYNPEKFALNANVIRVDVDSEEFTRIPVRHNWHNIHADIEQVVQPLLEMSLTANVSNFGSWWEQIHNWKERYPKPAQIPQEFSDGVSSYQLISHASQIFKDRTIVTGSSGTCMEMLLQAWSVHDNQRIVNSCGIGSMGFAIAAAIGVATKTNAEDLICVESDGSLAMNLQDLSTMLNMVTKFKVIVMDSAGYKSIALSQKRLNQVQHGNHMVTGLSLPDLYSIAKEMGFQVKTVDSDSQLQAQLSWLNACESSALLIVRVSAEEEALPRLISKPNAEGIMVTPEMQNLSPGF